MRFRVIGVHSSRIKGIDFRSRCAEFHQSILRRIARFFTHREIKGVPHRLRLIDVFVTHNPNIPVLGNAARIVVMHSNGQNASQKAAGNVDGCKEHIVSLLEGGEEAFKKRMLRYEY